MSPGLSKTKRTAVSLLALENEMGGLRVVLPCSTAYATRRFGRATTAPPGFSASRQMDATCPLPEAMSMRLSRAVTTASSSAEAKRTALAPARRSMRAMPSLVMKEAALVPPEAKRTPPETACHSTGRWLTG